jgi:alkylation response protein AidB-like acyl-CoA dehydrogenase
MEFGLTSEQVLMQDTLRRLLEDRQSPQTVLELIAEKYGGSGLSLLDGALVAEVAGESALIGALQNHHLAGLALELGGSEEQKERWLPLLASGEAIATIAWAETGDCWSPQSWSVKLNRSLLTGHKVHVPCAGHADIIIVGTSGGSLALVEKDTTGVDIVSFDGVDQTRRLSELHLVEARAELLPLSLRTVGCVYDFGLVLHAADAFGCAARLLGETKGYLSERKQFGFPLVQFQGVKHELANMAASLEPLRALWWYAAYACAERQEDASKMSALAKARICDVATSIARGCIDLHGAIGYTWEASPHLWYKRIMFDRAFLGGADTHFARAADLATWG